jgi:hypothetical protein
MGIWDWIVSIHRSVDWGPVVLFYLGVLAVVFFVLLQLLFARGRQKAGRALAAVRDLLDDVRALQDRLDELESHIGRRLDERDAQLDARVTRKIDSKADLLEERIEQRSASLSEAMSKLDSRISYADEEIDRFRGRVSEVENRIPGLFDRLDEFRGVLAKTFQAELGSVLSAFDSSVSGILEQMKAELRMGISRIESIESMVRSRERAERSLLGVPDEVVLPGAAARDQEDFEEWEQQAKEMAESDEPDEDERETLQAVPIETKESEEHYPAEMDTPTEEEPPDRFDDDLRED